MPPTRSRCSVCRRPEVAQINAALDLGFSYRWIRDRYGVALASLSRHVKHREAEKDSAAGPEASLEQRVERLEEELAVLRFVVRTDRRLAPGPTELSEDDPFPFL